VHLLVISVFVKIKIEEVFHTKQILAAGLMQTGVMGGTQACTAPHKETNT
jgi:hypothetical protein